MGIGVSGRYVDRGLHRRRWKPGLSNNNNRASPYRGRKIILPPVNLYSREQAYRCSTTESWCIERQVHALPGPTIFRICSMKLVQQRALNNLIIYFIYFQFRRPRVCCPECYAHRVPQNEPGTPMLSIYSANMHCFSDDLHSLYWTNFLTSYFT